MWACLEQSRSRSSRRIRMPSVRNSWNSLVADAGSGLRIIWRAPGLTVFASLSLGLGLAACLTILAIADVFLGFQAGSDGRDLLTIHRTRSGNYSGETISYPEYRDISEELGESTKISAHAFVYRPVVLQDELGSSRAVWCEAVSSNYFTVAGAPPYLGSGFLSKGDLAGSGAVISHRLWLRRYGGDHTTLGQTINLNGHHFVVVGVAPRLFSGSLSSLGMSVDVWVPLQSYFDVLRSDLVQEPFQSRGSRWLRTVAQLAPETHLNTVQTKLDVLAARLASVFPKTNSNLGLQLSSASALPFTAVEPISNAALALGIVSFLVLILACANVSTILLARMNSHLTDFGVKVALGAGPYRLARQAIFEAGAVALVGLVIGLFLAGVALQCISLVALPSALPMRVDVPLGFRSVVASACLTMLTTIFCGSLPALRISKANPADYYTARWRLRPHVRVLGATGFLVILQILLSVILLINGGLFLVSLNNSYKIDTGFRIEDVSIAKIDPVAQGYSPTEVQTTIQALKRGIEANPLVESVSFSHLLPLAGSNVTSQFSLDPNTDSGAVMVGGVNVVPVSPEFFSTLEIQRVAGVTLDWQEREVVPGAIVSSSLADRLWPNKDPLGQFLYQGNQRLEVLGVVADVKISSVTETRSHVVYLSLLGAGTGSDIFGFNVIVRTKPGVILPRNVLEDLISSVDTQLAVLDAKTMSDHVRAHSSIPHLTAAVFAACGLIGWIIATVGLFGVVSNSVSGQMREIAVRRALGATQGALLWIVYKRGLLLVSLGLVGGLSLAFWQTRLLASVLFGVSSNDLAVYLVVSVALVVSSLVAISFPNYRGV